MQMRKSYHLTSLVQQLKLKHYCYFQLRYLKQNISLEKFDANTEETQLHEKCSVLKNKSVSVRKMLY